jgi:hypothetical protein
LLEVTFLGHLGWMIAAGPTRILIDPILDDFFGAVPEAGLRPFPPRRSSPGSSLVGAWTGPVAKMRSSGPTSRDTELALLDQHLEAGDATVIP